MTFVVSMRLGEPPTFEPRARARLDALPDAALQARRDRRLDAGARRRARGDRRASTRVDLKGLYDGHGRRPAAPTRRSTGASPRRFPDAWIEDPRLTAETDADPRAAPRPDHAGTRTSTRSPTSRALPFAPRMVNIKPSRLGPLRELMRRLRLLRASTASACTAAASSSSGRAAGRSSTSPRCSTPTRRTTSRPAATTTPSRRRRPARQPAPAADRADRLPLGLAVAGDLHHRERVATREQRLAAAVAAFRRQRVAGVAAAGRRRAPPR